MTPHAAEALEVGKAYRFTIKRPKGRHEHVYEGRFISVRETGFASDGPKIVIRPLSTQGPLYVHIPPSFVHEVEEIA